MLERMQYEPHRLSLWWQDGSQDEFTYDITADLVLPVISGRF